MKKIRTTINGELITTTVEARLNLVDFLRNDQGLTGSHVGCEHGVCGACTVLYDGNPVRGCLVLAAQADGAEITTVEGAAESGRLDRLHSAFLKHNALQCGFCTPGMLLTALSLVESGKPCSRDDIRHHIAGNYCRCTGYQAIVDAIDEVVNTQ